MISADDIEAFRQSSEESIAQANEFARRARKGLPPDRWASDREAYLVARGIVAQATLISLLTEAIQEMHHGASADERRGKA